MTHVPTLLADHDRVVRPLLHPQYLVLGVELKPRHVVLLLLNASPAVLAREHQLLLAFQETLRVTLIVRPRYLSLYGAPWLDLSQRVLLGMDYVVAFLSPHEHVALEALDLQNQVSLDQV